MKKSLALIGLLGLCIVVYTQSTVLVIPPIGALPEGKTIIIVRLTNTEFIDSPDSICERIQGGVSLLCRGMVLAPLEIMPLSWVAYHTVPCFMRSQRVASATTDDLTMRGRG